MKLYDVILADPPWQYRKQIGDLATDDFYPTMPIEDICALPVKDIAAKNCALFLWVTPPTMFEYAPLVFEAWGFRPVTKAFCWVKSNPSGFGFFTGTGHYTTSNTEDCWLAIRGSMPRVESVMQIIYSPVREHSRKPDEQYPKIEKLYPQKNYLELFARRQRSGWDVFGNEVEGSIRLPTSRAVDMATPSENGEALHNQISGERGSVA
jgi:N6-adenosine-specific RNA methylase IME4